MTDLRDLLADPLADLGAEPRGEAPAADRPAAAQEDAGDALTRGLARAKAGDHQGAVAEFSAALAHPARGARQNLGRIYLERAYSYRSLGYTYQPDDRAVRRAEAPGASCEIRWHFGMA
jgi:hypothetical protein